MNLLGMLIFIKLLIEYGCRIILNKKIKKEKMRKKLLLFCFVLGTQIAFGQGLMNPTIPPSGILYQVATKADTIGFSNQGDWDFLAVVTDNNATIEVLPVSSSSSAGNYPNATHVKYEDGNEFFLGFSNSEYSFHGEISVLTSSYASPLVLHPYPFSVGDIHSDFQFDVPFTVPGGPPFLERDDQAYSEALSTGDLTMPNGAIYTNATLVHTTRTWTDGQVGSSPCITTLYAYHWWVAGYAIPVVQTSTMISSGQCPPNMVKVTKFLTGSVMGTSSLDVSGILIYPNPSTNSIHLKNGDRFVGAPYKLLYQLGKTVASGSVIKDSQKIDVSDLPGGVYTLILQDHTNQAVKVVIE